MNLPGRVRYQNMPTMDVPVALALKAFIGPVLNFAWISK